MEDVNTTTEGTTEAPAKKQRKLRAPKAAAAPKTASPAKAKAAPKAKAPKAERPKPVIHSFDTSYEGPSTVLNTRQSKTPINFARFGSLSEAALTDRDRKSMADLRAQFGQKVFTRANVDAGILRRLGERGYLEHVEGSDVAPDAKFRLTKRAFTKEAQA